MHLRASARHATISRPAGRKPVLALLAILAAPASLVAQAADEVLYLRAQVDVASDGSIRVTERIRVQSDSAFRHGLVRLYTTTRLRANGFGWIQLPFDFRSASLDGVPVSYRAATAGGPFGRSGLRVRAGGLLPVLGAHTFELAYETDRRVDYGPMDDALVWDVTGSDWRVPIREASVTLTVDGLAAPLTVSAWVGPKAGEGEPVATAWDSARGATATAPRPILPGESFSIGLTLPKWSIHALPYHREREWFWLDWRGWIEGAWALAFVAAIYVVMWLRVGRDPSGGPLVVEVAPPAGLSPAAMGYLHARRWHPRQYTAALVGLATRGAVRITRAGDRWVVERGRTGEAVTADERVVLRELMRDVDRVPLGLESTERLARGADALRRSLCAGLERAFFVENRRWFLAGLGVSATGLLALAWRWRFAIDPGSTVVAVILALWTLATVSLAVRAVGFVGHARAGGSRIAYAHGSLFTLIAVPFAIAEVGIAWGLMRMVPLHIVAAGLALGLTNAVFYHLLERPTLGGLRLLARVQGFRHFLETVDEDRLARRVTSMEIDTFDRYLPHAIALGVERHWAGRFGSLLLPPGGAGAATVPRPTWYVTDEGASRGDAARIATELTEALRPFSPGREPAPSEELDDHHRG